MIAKSSLVAGRRAPLRRAYLDDPERVLSVKWAATNAGVGADAFRSGVPVTVDFAVEIAGGEPSST